MTHFLRRAEQVLETATAAEPGDFQDCTICISELGAIRILTSHDGWALPALAADVGASAVFRVERRGSKVRVEAWSLNENCVLQRELPHALSIYAIRHPLTNWSPGQKALVPHVRNS